ncbi:MAG: DNA-3-methyladenine glycosylase [Gemmatimonadaceae bacterium]
MHRKALNHLRTADPKLALVIKRVGRCKLEPRAEGTHFDAVMRAIIYQQLSGKAAATILRRTLGLYGDRHPTPDELLATPDEKLRAVGLSRQKISYLKDLAIKVKTGAVPMEGLHELPDDDVLAALTAIKGVGRWTAQMFLMFRLGREDVLPVGDLGIQKAIMKSYGLRKMPSPDRVQRIGAKWAPHSTVACWYLWRSLDAKAPD